MKRGIQLFTIIILFSGLTACSMAFKHVREMPINDIDLTQIEDGTYTGDFTYAFKTYAVETTVKSHRISDIRVIQNRNSNHAKLAEDVIPRVIEAQTANVDAHTGATTTSKALLKAIERSLIKGIPDEYERPSEKAIDTETDAETGATSADHK